MINNVEIQMKYIGEGPMYGSVVPFLCVYAQQVLLEFIIFATQDDDEKFPFRVARVVRTKQNNIAGIDISIEEPVNNMYLIRTDNLFRRKFKRSYDIIKFETKNYIVTFGAYTDNQNPMTPNNLYLQCTTDFINLLAESKLVESTKQLKDTPFESLACIFDKKELAKELLRE